MMPGWLMWSEMCRPSLYVWWGNILFLSHNIQDILWVYLPYINFQSTCQDLSDLLYQPSTLLFATALYYLANMPYKFLNRSWSVLVRLLCSPRQRMSCKSPLFNSRIWLWQQSFSLTDRWASDTTPSKSAAWQLDLTALFKPNILLVPGTTSTWQDEKW